LVQLSTISAHGRALKRWSSRAWTTPRCCLSTISAHGRALKLVGVLVVLTGVVSFNNFGSR